MAEFGVARRVFTQGIRGKGKYSRDIALHEAQCRDCGLELIGIDGGRWNAVQSQDQLLDGPHFHFPYINHLPAFQESNQ
jgi:hypothetical protein